MVKKAKADGDGLVHHVVQHLEARQALGDALAQPSRMPPTISAAISEVAAQ
jgi:hypothetical protein